MKELEDSPKSWPPLGLPTGSVRALLTLLTTAVVITSVVRRRDLDLLWFETLLIALAHYFTTRRFVSLPPEVIEQLQRQGLVELESHPLFLPRHSIRTLILAAFVGLGIYLDREGRLYERDAISLLGIVAAYLLGAIVRGITGWFTRLRDRPPSRFWGDARALIVLAVMLAAAIPEFLNAGGTLPPELHKIALGLMLFYFGSR